MFPDLHFPSIVLIHRHTCILPTRQRIIPFFESRDKKGMNSFLPPILCPPLILLPPFIKHRQNPPFTQANYGVFSQPRNLKALLHRKDGTSNIHPLPIRTNNLPTPSNRQRKCLPRRHRHLRASRSHSPYLRRILPS